MSAVPTFRGDLTDLSYENLEGHCVYICHQCNCISKSGAGLASALFKKYPDANVFALKHSKGHKSIPGTVDVIKVIEEPGYELSIINIYGQYTPGLNKTNEPREEWFEFALQQLAQLKDIPTKFPKKIIFPYKIGCGLAGGDWKLYSKMLENYYHKTKEDFKIFISVYE